MGILATYYLNRPVLSKTRKHHAHHARMVFEKQVYPRFQRRLDKKMPRFNQEAAHFCLFVGE